MSHSAENDAPTYTREDLARAWDEGWEYGGAVGDSPKSDNPYARVIPPAKGVTP